MMTNPTENFGSLCACLQSVPACLLLLIKSHLPNVNDSEKEEAATIRGN